MGDDSVKYALPTFNILSKALSTDFTEQCGPLTYQMIVKDSKGDPVETTFVSYIDGIQEVSLNVLDSISEGDYSLSLLAQVSNTPAVNETISLFDVGITAIPEEEISSKNETVSDSGDESGSVTDDT